MLYKLTTIAKILNKDIRTATKLLTKYSVVIATEGRNRYISESESRRFLGSLGFSELDIDKAIQSMVELEGKQLHKEWYNEKILQRKLKQWNRKNIQWHP